jgi:rubredoxin
MTKYVCTVCGYIAEGSIPEFCPVCKAPASKFIEKKDNTYVTEHVVGKKDWYFPHRHGIITCIFMYIYFWRNL